MVVNIPSEIAIPPYACHFM